VIVGWKCAVCGVAVEIADPLAFTCPNRTPGDPHHVLHVVTAGVPEVGDPGELNPLCRYAPRSAWWAFARANGLSDEDCRALVELGGADFAVMPFERSAALSDRFGTRVWVKDETGNVAGSHKARHLVGILLHLLAAERLGLLPERPPLAIASCGNAALAAATLADRVDWPIDVYVPTWMDDAFGRRLDELGAAVHRCERLADDLPGDPALLRFREAVAEGAIPFTVQGPENGMCLDTGRSIGWEMADQADAAGVSLDRVLVQVGGGAFAACVGAGLGPSVRLDTVQAEGCAPLAAAWGRAADHDRPAEHWEDVMRAWPNPHSAADGILDDETYDWVADVAAMQASGGRPIVATEAEIIEANDLATAAGFTVSVTGSAGLAGLLHVQDELQSADTLAVIMSGVSRN
jgi:threonine dehydratase